MTKEFLTQYVLEQFGFMPRDITSAMRRAAEAAFIAQQQETKPDEQSKKP